MPPEQNPIEEQLPTLPVEVELYIQPDGSVVFADLAAELLPLAMTLDPAIQIACTPPQPNNQEEPHHGPASHAE